MLPSLTAHPGQGRSLRQPPQLRCIMYIVSHERRTEQSVAPGPNEKSPAFKPLTLSPVMCQILPPFLLPVTVAASLAGFFFVLDPPSPTLMLEHAAFLLFALQTTLAPGSVPLSLVEPTTNPRRKLHHCHGPFLRPLIWLASGAHFLFQPHESDGCDLDLILT